MIDPKSAALADRLHVERARALFEAHCHQIYRRTDWMFAGLMLLQWVAAIAGACWISPRTWAGSDFETHPHVLMAVVVGGILTSLPVLLALFQPGRLSTRCVIVIAQMLFSALLIHITGGRIETHFHVFGSLAFLAFYRDWRLLVPATVIVAADHFFRGLYWPESVFGVVTASSWRWLEHAGWVIFEDVFLFISCRQATCEMWDIAHRTAELEESQQSEHAIIEAALDAVVQMDMEGQVVGWNSQAAETFGWSASEACGSSLAELIIPPSVRNRHDQGLLHYRGTGEGPILNKRIEVTARHRDGHDLPVELAIAPIHFNGQTRFCAFVNDITRRREAEDALKRAKEAAENANRAKSDFLANISHEIRTPLNSILGFSDLLLRGEDQGEQAQRIDFVRSIHQSSQHLLGLINDLLDLSKIEAGQFQVDVQRCSPAQMIAEVVSSLRVRALETQLRLEYTWLTGIPETIATDPARLRQVLMNLVGNAIKFTHSGHVRIAARIDFQPGDPRLVIEVEDTGIGIADEHCDKIFAPFVQADSSVTREFGGTGLGLSISRRIVEALQGSISVRSKAGIGSTFIVSVPTGPLDNVPLLEFQSLTGDVSRKPRLANAIPRLPEARVLLIDDGETNRRLISLILRRAGCDVLTAENGQVGVELAQGGKFDLILMDMQMPVMDGYVATRTLRDRGIVVPIIALTAHALRGDEQKCLAAGCTGYLTKPVDVEQLVARIAEVLESRCSPATRPSAAAAPMEDASIVRSTLPTDDAEFADIVTEFVGVFRDKVQQMEAARGGSDVGRLHALAHSLKGTGGSAGFPVISEVATRLEQALVADDLERITDLVAELQSLSRRIAVPCPGEPGLAPEASVANIEQPVAVHVH